MKQVQKSVKVWVVRWKGDKEWYDLVVSIRRPMTRNGAPDYEYGFPEPRTDVTVPDGKKIFGKLPLGVPVQFTLTAQKTK